MDYAFLYPFNLLLNLVVGVEADGARANFRNVGPFNVLILTFRPKIFYTDSPFVVDPCRHSLSLNHTLIVL